MYTKRFNVFLPADHYTTIDSSEINDYSDSRLLFYDLLKRISRGSIRAL